MESVITDIKDENEFIALCRKRSVFNNEELVQHWRYSATKPFIVNFLYSYSFPHRINLEKLIELGIISDVFSVPRGFEKISRENFEKILTNTKTNNDIVVH